MASRITLSCSHNRDERKEVLEARLPQAVNVQKLFDSIGVNYEIEYCAEQMCAIDAVGLLGWKVR